MSVEIRQHRPGKDLKDFIGVAFEIYADDPAWIAPLNMEIRDRLTPEKNPFFEHAEVAFFTAHKDGKAVGRVSAQIDHEHLRIHRDNAGFFGFFDTVNDQEVALQLMGVGDGGPAGVSVRVLLRDPGVSLLVCCVVVALVGDRGYRHPRAAAGNSIAFPLHPPWARANYPHG